MSKVCSASRLATAHVMEAGNVAVVLRPGDARVIDVGGFDVVVHADEATTAGAFSLIETAETEVGGGPPLHVHTDCAESFIVLAGRYRMHIDGRDFDCPAGSFVYIPRGMRHTFQTAETGSRKLNLYTPAGMVGYSTSWRQGSQPASMPPVSTRSLDATAWRSSGRSHRATCEPRGRHGETTAPPAPDADRRHCRSARRRVRRDLATRPAIAADVPPAPLGPVVAGARRSG